MSTISDVARRANVSPVTVSRVLNGAANVNPDTRARVKQAIQELGYLPNLAARSLRSRQTLTFALLVPDITNVFWTTVARGVEDAAQGGGYSVLLCNTDEDPAKQANYLRVVLQQRVDGVILAPCDSDGEKLNPLREQNTPTVIIDRRVDGWEVDTVWSDSISGARALVQHLISLGHREIALINGPVGASTSNDRHAGYCLALYQAGIPYKPELVRRGAFQHASGYRMTRQIFEEGHHPTAIFAANNLIATGALEALQERSLRIPEDVALVSFDDLPDVARFFPFLTVVNQPAYDIGLNAAQLLLSRMNADISLPIRHVVLPTRLVLRLSCGQTLKRDSRLSPSLPLASEIPVQTILVKPLSAEEKALLPLCAPGLTLSLASRNERQAQMPRADAGRLLAALRRQPTDRLAYFETRMPSRPLMEYILERSLLLEGSRVSALDHVEFARRLGIDAVPCDFSWQRPDSPDENGHTAPTSLADQLGRLESYLHAAQGTGVGVFASFPLSVIVLQSRQSDAENWVESVLRQQIKMVDAVCDRFSADLAFVLFEEPSLDRARSPAQADRLTRFILPHLQKLITPAHEHGLLVGVSSSGPANQILQAYAAAGFDFVHLEGEDTEPLEELRQYWDGSVALAGGIPTRLLLTGKREGIEAYIRQLCQDMTPEPGFVLSSSAGIPEGVPPENVFALVRAIQQYGVLKQNL
ncbi:MAG TPA: substrate-binding domain-containing protein [Anaerolineaceae bacterium]|nr:substrate-binding domain-containing protein [Anaerolineaceae bacterium]